METLTYSGLKNWSIDIPNLFPDKCRILNDVLLGEFYWQWNENKIHVDHYSNETAQAKIIVLHSLGGTGRLLSFIGIPLWRKGFEVLCPDIPPFGLSLNTGQQLIYPEWILMISDMINHESTLDDKPIFLLGHGFSGMLAYQVASINQNVKGIIVTSLLDQREEKVKNGEAMLKIHKTINMHGIDTSKLETEHQSQMNEIMNINKIVQDKGICQLLSEDKYSWKMEVNKNLFVSLMMTDPLMEPEDFDKCPILLVFPENDRLTPLELTQPFFDRLGCRKRLVVLKNASHLPIEEPGLSELEMVTTEFIHGIVAEKVTSE
jgi:alpha-beta hydrolase superfamily lysophospholipase